MSGFISSEMSAMRVVSKGKVAALPFRMKSGALPFSVIVIPKANIENGVISTPQNEGIIINCKCYQDQVASPYPVQFIRATEAAIVEIPAAGIDLGTYDVYWGCGAKAEVE